MDKTFVNKRSAWVDNEKRKETTECVCVCATNRYQYHLQLLLLSHVMSTTI